MTKEEMKEGFSQGRRLVQECWASPDEIKAVDELLSDKLCTTDGWKYIDEYEGRARILIGVKAS